MLVNCPRFVLYLNETVLYLKTLIPDKLKKEKGPLKVAPFQLD
jgi:hypothetical protein